MGNCLSWKLIFSKFLFPKTSCSIKISLRLDKNKDISSINFKIGTVALARTDKKNTEDSQFFILLEDAPLFEGEYSPVGKVIYGLEVLQKIKYSDKVEYVLRPDFINTFKMLN